MPQTCHNGFYDTRGPSLGSDQSRLKYQARSSNLEEEITRSHELLANMDRIIAGMKTLEEEVKENIH